MKKLLCALLILSILLLALAGCNNKSPNQPSDTTGEAQVPENPLKIGVLSGTTGMGIAKLASDLKASDDTSSSDIRQYYDDIVIYTEPSTLLSDMIAKKVDVAALPTNAAATLFNKSNGDVKALAINTLGVLYILDNTNEIKSLSDLEGKTVYVATPGQTPEYILRSIIEKNNVENVTFAYDYTDLDTLTGEVAKGEKVKIALLPEPKVTIAMTKAASMNNANLAVAIDLTEEWNKVQGTTLTQGCIVARKDVIENQAIELKQFLKDYKVSIEFVTNPENVDSASEMIAATGILPNAAVAKKALPKCNIAYLDGQELKDALSGFLKVLFDMDAKAVGGTLPNDDFYLSDEDAEYFYK